MTVSQCSQSRCQNCGGSLRRVDGFLTCIRCGEVHGRDFRESLFTIEFTTHSIARPDTMQYVNIGNTSTRVAGNGSYVGKPVPRKDNNGQKLSSAARQKAMTLRKYNNRARWTNRDVRIANAFRALEVPLQQLELPHIVLRRAGEILQRSIDSWDMKNIHPVAVASFLWAVRQYDIPVSEQEILDVYPHASFAVPTLNKAKFHLQEALGDIFPLLSAAQFVPRYLSELRKLQDVRERARINDVDLERYFCEIEKRTYSVLRQVKGHSDFQGRCPPALAASAIYAMLRIDEPPKLLTQKNLEEATAVTSYSVRCHWVRLWKPILERSGLLKQNNNGGEKTV